jgi:transcriptional activator/AAA domain-containing protein
MERLAANLSRTVTLVTANAGAGKTTLVADFVREYAPRFVWYQLDHTDADPAVFLSYIAYGIQQFVPDFGQATLAYLRQSPAEVGQRPERAVDALLNEALDYIDQPMVIVLDDYHHLGDNEQYLHMLETLAIAAFGQKEWPRALPLASQNLRDAPYREDIHCLVMRTHAAQGNRAAVKEQYETLRDLLRKELGVEPASETQKVYRGLIG